MLMSGTGSCMGGGDGLTVPLTWQPFVTGISGGSLLATTTSTTESGAAVSLGCGGSLVVIGTSVVTYTSPFSFGDFDWEGAAVVTTGGEGDGVIDTDMDVCDSAMELGRGNDTGSDSGTATEAGGVASLGDFTITLVITMPCGTGSGVATGEGGILGSLFFVAPLSTFFGGGTAVMVT